MTPDTDIKKDQVKDKAGERVRRLVKAVGREVVNRKIDCDTGFAAAGDSELPDELHDSCTGARVCGDAIRKNSALS